jgi:acetyl esterase
MTSSVSLEPAAAEFARATAKPPYLFDLGPAVGRRKVDEVQATPGVVPPVDVEDRSIPGGPGGALSVRILRPKGGAALLPVIVYFHGAGWVFGNEHTHDRLIRELVVGSGAAVVFLRYSLSPEARYPTAVEECYAALHWVSGHGRVHGLDPDRIAVAGDSVGGNLAAAVTLMAKERRGPGLRRQLLFYPVTDAAMDTPSYEQFATGYFLRRDAMAWFWDQYAPDRVRRAEISASPLRATLEELRGLPEALVITAEADVLRDEGEAYAARLREAGVRVTAARFQRTIHDFVMLNALADTAAARGAMALANGWLREGFAPPR